MPTSTSTSTTTTPIPTCIVCGRREFRPHKRPRICSAHCLSRFELYLGEKPLDLPSIWAQRPEAEDDDDESVSPATRLRWE